MLGVFLQHAEAEDVGIELLGTLEVEHAQEDVADAGEANHPSAP